jgi:hypothetical protein
MSGDKRARVFSMLIFGASLFMGAASGAFAAGPETQLAQASNQPPIRAQKDLDYWQRKGKEFAAIGAATDSPTKKQVMAALVDSARKHVEDAQRTLDAIAKQSTTLRPASPQFQLRVQPAVPPPRVAAPPPPARPQTGGGPPPVNAGPSGISTAQCPPNANDRWQNPQSPEDMVEFTGEQFECDAPGLRDTADAYRRSAADEKQVADKDPTPLGKKVYGDESAEKSDIANALVQVAGRMRERVSWTGANIVAAAVPRTQDGNLGLCAALTKPAPRKDESNDPYLMCDCVQEYLTERLNPLYDAMLGRIKPQTAFANVALYASFNTYKDVFLGIAVQRARNMFVAIGGCKDLLFLSEHQRALEAEDAPDRGLTPADLGMVRSSAYTELMIAVDDLWRSFHGEIATGINALTEIERDQERVFAAKLHGMQKPTRGDLQAFCASDDSAAQARVNWLGREMSALVAAMQAVRPSLSRELRLWQDFAARDGWPNQKGEVSFGEMADRLQTSAHLRGWVGAENGIAGIVVGTESLDGICDKWNPSAPGSVYMMVGNDPGAPAIEGAPRAAPPSIVNALRNYDPPYRYDGPFTSAKTNGVWLMLPLFEAGNESAVAFYSGADATQHP